MRKPSQRSADGLHPHPSQKARRMGHPRLIRAPLKKIAGPVTPHPSQKARRMGHPRLIRAPLKEIAGPAGNHPKGQLTVYTPPVAKNATNGAPAVDLCTSKKGQLGTRPLCPCLALCETWEVEYHSSRRYFRMLRVVEMRATESGSRRTRLTASQLCR
jgi:hypothetical protein